MLNTQDDNSLSTNSVRTVDRGKLVLAIAKILALATVFLLSMSCAVSQNTARGFLHQSNQYYNYLQPTFADYMLATERWLSKNRTFISDSPAKEIEMNKPFALGDPQAEKAILLVHGLGDSPYSFSDVAQSLSAQGFYVQTLLLPGHGSKPEDLMLPDYADWQAIVDHYATLLKQDYESVWLGGFSTGGNLVTIHAIENDGVDGLILFSPGFQSNIPVIERFARFASLFIDVYERRETNLVKYSSGVINGAIAYTESAFKLRHLFTSHTIEIPTLLVISENDSAVDSLSERDMYLAHFQNHKNKLIWYGNSGPTLDTVQYFNMQLSHARITTGSHISPLFAADNPYYGVLGDRRMCKTFYKALNGPRCSKPNESLWFAAWGYQEEGKQHTRLTWNPYYEELEQAMLSIVN